MAASANVFEEEMEEEEEEVQATLPSLLIFGQHLLSIKLVVSVSDQYIDIHPLPQMELGDKEESSESKSFKSDISSIFERRRPTGPMKPSFELVEPSR